MRFPISKNDPVEQVPAYTVLAQAYDAMMSHVNYQRWAEFVVQMLRVEGVTAPMPFLDVGCGTGRFLQEMRNIGWPGDGCDPSSEMIVQARKILPAANLFSCGLPELEEIQAASYPLVTCLYDTLNYLPDRECVSQSLQRIWDCLSAKGFFIFDVVSESHCRRHFQHYADSEVISKALAYSRESHYNSSERIQYNWIRIYTPEGIYEEEHQQRIYPLGELKKLIAHNTQFSIAHIYEDFSLEPADRHSGRLHIVLKKNHD